MNSQLKNKIKIAVFSSLIACQSAFAADLRVNLDNMRVGYDISTSSITFASPISGQLQVANRSLCPADPLTPFYTEAIKLVLHYPSYSSVTPLLSYPPWLIDTPSTAINCVDNYTISAAYTPDSDFIRNICETRGPGYHSSAETIPTLVAISSNFSASDFYTPSTVFGEAPLSFDVKCVQSISK